MLYKKTTYFTEINLKISGSRKTDTEVSIFLI